MPLLSAGFWLNSQPPFSRYQIILPGDSVTRMWTICPGSLPDGRESILWPTDRTSWEFTYLRSTTPPSHCTWCRVYYRRRWGGGEVSSIETVVGHFQANNVAIGAAFVYRVGCSDNCFKGQVQQIHTYYLATPDKDRVCRAQMVHKRDIHS